MNTEDVERVSFTARLDLGDGETDSFTDEFEDILGWFSEIDEVDTEDVEPAFHPIDLEGQVREDVVEETLDIDELADKDEITEDGYFIGPRIR